MLLTTEITLKRQTRTKVTKLQFTKCKKSKRSLENCFQTRFQLDLRILSLTKDDLIHKQELENVRASLIAQTVKNPPAMQETWVQSLGWENPLEESMATHSSILARRIPTDRGAWQATVHGVIKSQIQLSD